MILPDLYISSYTSTLSALLPTSQSRMPIDSADGKLALIGPSSTSDEQTDPKTVSDELARIKVIYPDATEIIDVNTTHDEFFDVVARHPWIHLACAGNEERENALGSSFSISKEPLLLSDIVKRRLSNVELAFLSARRSAKGEGGGGLHLTAALQFIGFRSVVGTLWETDSEDRLDVVAAFYKNMQGQPSTLSANALHRGVAALRQKGVSPLRWARFVHFGY